MERIHNHRNRRLTTKGNFKMRTVDLVILILVILTGAFAAWLHFDARDDCLAMVKPKTDSTPRPAKFTGKYERTNGVLYCFDTKGVKHSYRNRK